MGVKRKKHGSKYKARVALEAAAGDKTMAELSRKHGIHSKQITQWRGNLLERAYELFERGKTLEDRSQERLIDELYSQIGTNRCPGWPVPKRARPAGSAGRPAALQSVQSAG